MEQMPVKPKVPPKRRERRRPGRMMQEYERRQRKHRWLETHMWHAKRMHMDTAFGYRLVRFDWCVSLHSSIPIAIICVDSFFYIGHVANG